MLCRLENMVLMGVELPLAAIRQQIALKNFKQFLAEEDGMGTVEVILIIVEIYILYIYAFNVYTVI